MKNTFLLAIAFFFVKTSIAQELTGKKDVSSWTLFSSFTEKPQFKKIDDEKFFAFYRTSTDDAGIVVMDAKLNVHKDIQLKLTKTKKIFYNTKAYLDLLSHPTYYYRKENNSVVIIGNIRISDKDYAVVGMTYSLDSESLIKVDTLLHAQSMNCDVRLSKNENYFVVWEYIKKDKSSNADKKLEKYRFDVFDAACNKVYSAQLDQPKGTEVYIKLLTNGELIGTTIDEETRKTEYKYYKFDINGKLAGTLSMITGRDEFYTYYLTDFLESPANDVYVVYAKADYQVEGIAVFQIDFAKNSCKKVIDKNIDKDYLKEIYAKAELNHSMIKDKQIKPIKALSDFYIQQVFCDKNGIYLMMQDIKTKQYPPTKGGEMRISYSSENIIAFGFGYDGKEKWATPIKRDAQYYDVTYYDEKQINLYNANGTGIGISYFEDENNINMIVPSMNKIYATKIDKNTGKDIVPVLLNDDDKAYTNKNCLFWMNPNQVVITTMKGIYFALSQKEVYLHSLKVTL